jgi:serine O-acetyltransferase
MISSGARIGSNAVVLKDVGAGNTVVGVPGRIIKGDKSELERKRKAIADKIGFDAYGMHDEMPDPVANAINNMLDHMHTMDQRLEQMCSAIKGLGAEIVDMKMPDLGPCEISSAVSAEMEENLENQGDEQPSRGQDES